MNDLWYARHVAWNYGKRRSQKIGKLGEDIAVRYLKMEGYTILERNIFRVYGEIDIVAQKENTVWCVEVKALLAEKRAGKWKTKSAIRPEENFTQEKRKKFERSATLYAHMKKLSTWRMCLVVVYIDQENKYAKCEMILDL